ncbi:MAG: SpoIIE family protein phosphatase [Calditerrivibrio sp.]|nr:SpoIIE family protein phosphatase [Calditerrivibrio sp.]MCA1933080.1 SpoIIE family protein phosphatase [Calditerrivibrio sp.]MCA1980248.1 SpoIIE family protein phosphatase [Calditerrivibrio sp.]
MNEKIFNILLSENINSFIKNIQLYLDSLNIKKYIIWEINNNIAIPYVKTIEEEIFFCDITDLGYQNIVCSDEPGLFSLSEGVDIYKSLFLVHNEILLMAISICEETSLKCKEFYDVAELLSTKLYELRVNESRTNMFIEYQKKIDFIKKASDILRSVEIENIVPKSLSFFMDIFESEAGVAIQNNESYLIGFSKEDMDKHIFIDGIPMTDFIETINKTEYIDSGISSEKFLINNLFVVYEPKIGLKVAIFNVKSSFYPDKEFSEIIAHITSIAVENAINHKNEVRLKLEEKEMNTTADILNRFVDKEISFVDDGIQIFGVSYPAKQTGGDFLGIHRENDNIIICLADVCGKGYSAAVITVAISTMFEQIKTQKTKTPSMFAENLTKFLLDKRLEGRFVTIFIGVISIKQKKMSYISLGHEPVFIINGDNVIKISSEYMPSGIILEEYIDSVVNLENNSSIFIYSDGLIEYIDYNNLEKILLLQQGDPETFIKNLYDSLVTDKSNQMDDFTCIKIDMKG